MQLHKSHTFAIVRDYQVLEDAAENVILAWGLGQDMQGVLERLAQVLEINQGVERSLYSEELVNE